MTLHLSERAASDCPCGRVHPRTTEKQPRRLRHSEAGLPAKAYDAFVQGKAVKDHLGIWWIHNSGNCESPLTMSCHNSKARLTAKRLVRCRRCVECLHARKYYWAMAALEQTKQARRTWFGTLTFDDQGQSELVLRAKANHPHPNAEWWDETVPVTYWCHKRERWITVDGYPCDERYLATAREALKEVVLFWKRLRKAGHTFKYFLVFERHKSGLVHAHFLLHEQDKPILKRDLQSQWPWGWSHIKLVGTTGKRPVTPDKAAWYVAKYLSKSHQARQIASKGYRPAKRALNRHSEVNTSVKHSEEPRGDELTAQTTSRSDERSESVVGT